MNAVVFFDSSGSACIVLGFRGSWARILMWGDLQGDYIEVRVNTAFIPLVVERAAMRAYVASKFGETVDLP